MANQRDNFVTNLQGDVIYIYDDEGNKLVSYTYDAWGNHTVTYTNGGASTAAQYNLFRYRGYYYDTETGLYYLNSRYYNPQIGRFINADAYVSTGQGLLGSNMFAYCLNNPVNFVDLEGESVVGFLLIVSLGTLLLSGCADMNESTSSYSPSELYVNEYTEEKGYLSNDDCTELVKAMAPQIIAMAEANNFEQEYGSVIYQFKPGNQYGEDPSLYWITPPHPGYNDDKDPFAVKKWDPNMAKFPYDVKLVGDVHIHLKNADYKPNGGFSGGDIEGMLGVPGIYYVITYSVESPTKYRISIFDYNKNMGVYLN